MSVLGVGGLVTAVQGDRLVWPFTGHCAAFLASRPSPPAALLGSHTVRHLDTVRVRC